jgi:hypothetical protein
LVRRTGPRVRCIWTPIAPRSIARASEGYLRTVAQQSWRIVQVGDFDGDGKSDILWRNSSTGDNYLYPMDGTTIKPTEYWVRTVDD